MEYKNCKLCAYEDDVDYLHPLYDGKSDKYILICEKCRENLFSDRERSKREDLIEEAEMRQLELSLKLMTTSIG